MELPEKTVEEQVHAYNAHDVEKFASFYSADIAILDLPTGRVQSHGIEELRSLYTALFTQNPSLHVEVVRRSVIGRYVIDEERVSGLPPDRKMQAVAVYEVIDGLIRRVWFVNG